MSSEEGTETVELTKAEQKRLEKKEKLEKKRKLEEIEEQSGSDDEESTKSPSKKSNLILSLTFVSFYRNMTQIEKEN